MDNLFQTIVSYAGWGFLVIACGFIIFLAWNLFLSDMLKNSKKEKEEKNEKKAKESVKQEEVKKPTQKRVLAPKQTKVTADDRNALLQEAITNSNEENKTIDTSMFGDDDAELDFLKKRNSAPQQNGGGGNKPSIPPPPPSF